jgi:hypothetical protein
VPAPTIPTLDLSKTDKEVRPQFNTLAVWNTTHTRVVPNNSNSPCTIATASIP